MDAPKRTMRTRVFFYYENVVRTTTYSTPEYHSEEKDISASTNQSTAQWTQEDMRQHARLFPAQNFDSISKSKRSRFILGPEPCWKVSVTGFLSTKTPV